MKYELIILALIAIGLTATCFMFFQAGKRFYKRALMAQHEKKHFWCCLFVSRPHGEELSQECIITVCDGAMPDEDVRRKFLDHLHHKGIAHEVIQDSVIKFYKNYIPAILSKEDY